MFRNFLIRVFVFGVYSFPLFGLSAGCGGDSDYQQGYKSGFDAGVSAGGTRGLPPPNGKNEDFKKGFGVGWQEGLSRNPKLAEERRLKQQQKGISGD